jgi:hypothetical protein
MIRRIVIAALLLALSGCSLPFDLGREMELRFSNVSSYAFRDVTYRSGRVLYFDHIPSGVTTECRSIGWPKRYGTVELFMGSKRLVLQPVDYVGEEPFGGGRFTFVVSLDGTSVFSLGLQRG